MKKLLGVILALVVIWATLPSDAGARTPPPVSVTYTQVWDYWGSSVAAAVQSYAAQGYELVAIDRQTPYGDSGWNFVTIYFRPAQ